MSSKPNKYLIVLAGPTAIGKTDMAIKVAKRFDSEIISADSRQFYIEMNIGTAKPSNNDLYSVPHHFVNILSVDDDYTAGQFEKEVLTFLESYFKSKDIAIMTGGSGMFIDAVCYGFDETPRDLKIREELNAIFEAEGLSPLLKNLKELDPVHYERVDKNNPQRVIRALEVYKCTGKPYSTFLTHTPKQRPFEIIYLVLEMDRQELYERIDKRVDVMVDSGLIQEVESLTNQRNRNALKTVGYKEVFSFLDNDISLEECVEEIKKNTRNYAKRQITWFKKNKDATWVDARDEKGIHNIIESSMKRRSK